MTMLLLAAFSFVGTHFILSHPLRGLLVRALGDRIFLALYSVVAIATFVWMVVAYQSTPIGNPEWAVGTGLWVTATALTLVASLLLAGSLIGNPAFPKGAAPDAPPGNAHGVFSITRHPMFWSFALWGVAHILVYPVAPTFVVAGSIIILSLVGAVFQDRKKMRLQPSFWPLWVDRTSFIPLAAMVGGRARLGGFGMAEIAGGLTLWLAASWAHLPLAGVAAGVWAWI